MFPFGVLPSENYTETFAAERYISGSMIQSQWKDIFDQNMWENVTILWGRPQQYSHNIITISSQYHYSSITILSQNCEDDHNKCQEKGNWGVLKVRRIPGQRHFKYSRFLKSKKYMENDEIDLIGKVSNSKETTIEIRRKLPSRSNKMMKKKMLAIQKQRGKRRRRKIVTFQE